MANYHLEVKRLSRGSGHSVTKAANYISGDKRLCYIIGELVAKHFPKVLRFEPGTKADNIIEFEPIDQVLSVLAKDKELIRRLKDLCTAGSG